ncbi:MAG: hypothetical protein NWF11_04680 [Candidatus Bathyarchaeota archaeon]|nr:hypothetical protein [Candidatus Bathyarchaeota archaeon]
MPEEALRIEKLSRQLTVLKKQRDSLNEEARLWTGKRDEIHKQIKDLRLEAANIRERRDETNTKVKALKIQRNLTRNLKKESIEEIKKLQEKYWTSAAKQPKRALEVLKKEIEKIEWTIQTSSLTLQEERPMIRRANELQKELKQYEQATGLRSKISELQESINTMNEEAEILHKQLSKLALQSQQFHDRMIETLKKTKELKMQADEYHRNFVSNRSKSQVVHGECLELESVIKELKRSLNEIAEKSKLEQQSEKRKKLKKQALKKMKEGDKLTFEEFKLVVEKEKN